MVFVYFPFLSQRAEKKYQNIEQLGNILEILISIDNEKHSFIISLIFY